MDSTSDRAKQIIERYRESKSLPRESRRRVGRQIERRIEYGELSALNINVDPPKLPSPPIAMASSTTTALVTKTGIAVMVVATSAVMAWRAVIANSKNETVSRTAVESVVSAPQPTQVSAVDPMASPSVTTRSAPSSEKNLADPSASTSPQPAIARGLRSRLNSPKLSNSADKTPIKTSSAGSPIKSNSDLLELVSEIRPVTDNRINAIDDHSAGSSIEEKDAPTSDQKPTEPTRPPTSSQPPRSSLDEEVKLLQSAYAALRAHQPERALAQLAEHTWRFPHGELAESREVARILALCRMGKREASRAEAAQFLSERPHSPFAARVRSICGQSEETVP